MPRCKRLFKVFRKQVEHALVWHGINGGLIIFFPFFDNIYLFIYLFFNKTKTLIGFAIQDKTEALLLDLVLPLIQFRYTYDKIE